MDAILSSDIFRWGSFILHSLGVAIGAGGAYLSDAILFTSMRNHVISKSEIKFIRIGGSITMMGLWLLIFSGIGIFSTDPERYLNTPKFIAKMFIVGVLMINGFVLHHLLVPVVVHHVGTYLPHADAFMKKSRHMFACGAISAVSWTVSLTLGSMRGFTGSLGVILSVYSVLLIGGIVVSQLARRSMLLSKKNAAGHIVLPEGDYTKLKG